MSTTIVIATICLTVIVEKASTNADIRLAGGNSRETGRLEVLVDGEWGTVCDAQLSFLKREADVACRQLGYGQAADYGSYTSFTATGGKLNFSLPVVMSDVSCLMSASRLQVCTFSTSSSGCSRSDDIGVTCSNCSMYLCSDGECVDGELCDGNQDCADGSDEDALTCDIIDAIGNALSTTLRIVIGVAVVVVVLLIGIPVAICICVCMCTGACICCATNKRRPAATPQIVQLEKI